MVKSHKKYLDPTDVLKAVVDDAGNVLKRGRGLKGIVRKESNDWRTTRYHRISFEFLGKN